LTDFLSIAKESSRIISTLDGATKTKILIQMADILIQNEELIISENKKDLDYGQQNNLSSALMDRLLLNEKRINDMSEALKVIAKLTEPVGRVLDGWINENNLKIEKVSVPIGVIGIIYESRPNVTSDTAGLCFKSGNVAILKGGKEAENSNKIIAKLLQDVLEANNLPREIISLLPDSSREGVANLIKQDRFVDLIIPRGGEGLIRYVTSNASVPVVKHDKGLCHTYIHKDADFDKAIAIAVNAKTQRTGVCNATETLLVDFEVADEVLPKLKQAFDEAGTELKGCGVTRSIIETNSEATDEDFNTEYLANILNIKTVSGVFEAVNHINQYGSQHSEAIITENYTVAEQFMNNIDASTVYLNASTRFTDGAVFGFGAEVGISTNKLHSRGPMGINDLTTYKYKVYGNGQIKE
jgi:glutamate-5-semialdehyde dehydrogenase